MMAAAAGTEASVVSAKELFEHWQGHRRLTRKTIEAFPEDKLFSFSVGGMRPFSEMAVEFLKMAAPTVKGLATGKWESFELANPPRTKQELLKAWDEATEEVKALWPTVPAHRFAEVDKAFGQWESSGRDLILYVIENEVHHRGQGFVYLRALGIEPPAFYDRN